MSARAKAFTWIIFGYLVALLAAALAASWAADWLLLGRMALAQLVAVAVLFGFSRAFSNTAFFNPYWSLAPIAVGAYLAALASPELPWLRQALVMTLVTVWGLRLTYNWARGWDGWHVEDWSYSDIRAKTGRLWWTVSFLGLHFFPAALVFGGMLPLYPALVWGIAPLGWLDLLALAVTAGAIWLEATADGELYRFRKAKPAPEAIMDKGLWSISRHPNYLGEMGFWCGLALFGLAASPGEWWRVIGAVCIVSLFVFITIPMIERRHLARRPGYREHSRRVPILLPRLGWPGQRRTEP